LEPTDVPKEFWPRHLSRFRKPEKRDEEGGDEKCRAPGKLSFTAAATEASVVEMSSISDVNVAGSMLSSLVVDLR